MWEVIQEGVPLVEYATFVLLFLPVSPAALQVLVPLRPFQCSTNSMLGWRWIARLGGGEWVGGVVSNFV